MSVQILAASADGALVERLARAVGAAPLTILLATPHLETAPDREALIGRALSAWSHDRLAIVTVDGAIPPLGLRDIHPVHWRPNAPGSDDALRRGLIGSQPGSAAPPAARPRKDRRVLMAACVAFILVIGAAIAWYGVSLPVQHELPIDAAPPAFDERPPPPMPPAQAAPPSAGAQPTPARTPTAPAPIGATAPEATQASPPPAAAPAPPPAQAPATWPSLAAAALVLAAIAAFAWRQRRRLRRGQSAAPPASTPPTPQPQAAAATPAPDFFLSYSSNDAAAVQRIRADIEGLGHRVWTYENDMRGGEIGWAAQIVRALREARAVVVLGSRSAYGSDQVVREMYLAMSFNKPIIPIELEPVELPDDLLYILAKFQRHRIVGAPTRDALARALDAA